jgi:hypothetical protein
MGAERRVLPALDFATLLVLPEAGDSVDSVFGELVSLTEERALMS